MFLMKIFSSLNKFLSLSKIFGFKGSECPDLWIALINWCLSVANRMQSNIWSGVSSDCWQSHKLLSLKWNLLKYELNTPWPEWLARMWEEVTNYLLNITTKLITIEMTIIFRFPTKSLLNQLWCFNIWRTRYWLIFSCFKVNMYKIFQELIPFILTHGSIFSWISLKRSATTLFISSSRKIFLFLEGTGSSSNSSIPVEGWNFFEFSCQYHLQFDSFLLFQNFFKLRNQHFW